MATFNHFDHHAKQYQISRPNYPEAMFSFISQYVKGHDLVWDCATGNGQAALAWTKQFKKIIATDISKAQLEEATKHPKIEYRCRRAEESGLANHSVDLITVAQALHWFDLPAFYHEVKRVAKPEAVIAAWCYSIGHFDCSADKIIHNLYDNILGDRYWAKERGYVDKYYETILFPFQRIQAPEFIIEKDFNLEQLMGYLSTWSAVREYERVNHVSPLNLIKDELVLAWGGPEIRRKMRWPIHLLLAKVHEDRK